MFAKIRCLKSVIFKEMPCTEKRHLEKYLAFGSGNKMEMGQVMRQGTLDFLEMCEI